jgi:hypothetical protein
LKNKHVISALLTVSTATFALTSCSSGSDDLDSTPTSVNSTPSDASTTVADNDGCTALEGAAIEANHKPGEPTFSIPLPAGWERNTMLDSDLVRLGIGHAESPTSTSSAVITLEKTAAPVGELDLGLGPVAVPGSIEEQELGTTCGFVSQRTDYAFASAQGETPATLLAVSVPSENGYITAGLTVQQSDADAKHYEQTKEEILDGFTVVPAPGNNHSAKA